jgi:hypothetical protein
MVRIQSTKNNVVVQEKKRALGYQGNGAGMALIAECAARTARAAARKGLSYIFYRVEAAGLYTVAPSGAVTLEK